MVHRLWRSATPQLKEGMEREFLAEVVATTIYFKNHSPTKAVPGMTPEEAWSGMKPSVAHLRSFGCKAYAHVPDQKRTKLDSKTRECIFLGYSEDSKAYRLFDPRTRNVIKSRDVIFDEQDNKKSQVNEEVRENTTITTTSKVSTTEEPYQQDPASITDNDSAPSYDSWDAINNETVALRYRNKFVTDPEWQQRRSLADIFDGKIYRDLVQAGYFSSEVDIALLGKDRRKGTEMLFKHLSEQLETLLISAL
jgi:hypothetical protein